MLHPFPIFCRTPTSWVPPPEPAITEVLSASLILIEKVLVCGLYATFWMGVDASMKNAESATARSETAAFRLKSPELCAKCHADKALMQKYGISTEVFSTYVSDFHGTTVELFEKQSPDQPTNKPVCIDCHGVHDIASARDENSAMQTNLVKRCQECHPDATANFASSWLGHYAPDWRNAPLVAAVTWFYRILIPALLAFFIIYIAIDAQFRFRKYLKRRKEAEA